VTIGSIIDVNVIQRHPDLILFHLAIVILFCGLLFAASFLFGVLFLIGFV